MAPGDSLHRAQPDVVLADASVTPADNLTGLPNRAHFMARLETAIARPGQENGLVGLSTSTLTSSSASTTTREVLPQGLDIGDEVIVGFARRVSEVRRAKARQISQEDVAMLAGMSRGIVNRALRRLEQHQVRDYPCVNSHDPGLAVTLMLPPPEADTAHGTDPLEQGAAQLPWGTSTQ